MAKATPNTPARFRVIGDEEGLMLRVLLSRRLPDLSRNQVEDLIHAGGVYVNNLRIRVGTVRVAVGERVTVYREALESEALDLASIRFVHREESFVVVDKAQGVPCSPSRACARGSLSEALVHLLQKEGHRRPYVGVVHRLDRRASGLILFTTRSVANKSLHKQFVEHSIQRVYRLHVHGHAPESTRCDRPLLSLRRGGVQVAEAGEKSAQPAVTHFRRLALFGDGTDGESLLEATLETGRTHQIRAHAAAMGWPILGDHRYGATSGSEQTTEKPVGLHLHAHRMEFEHPLTGAPLAFESQLPSWAKVS